MLSLDELTSRRVLSSFSWRGTVEDYRYEWGASILPVGIHVVGGNEIVEVKKDGFRDLGGIGNPWTKRSHGSLFFMRFTCYELTDSEWGWHH